MENKNNINNNLNIENFNNIDFTSIANEILNSIQNEFSNINNENLMNNLFIILNNFQNELINEIRK